MPSVRKCHVNSYQNKITSDCWCICSEIQSRGYCDMMAPCNIITFHKKKKRGEPGDRIRSLAPAPPSFSTQANPIVVVWEPEWRSSMLNPRFCLFVSHWRAGWGLKLPSFTLLGAPGAWSGATEAEWRGTGLAPPPRVFPLECGLHGKWCVDTFSHGRSQFIWNGRHYYTRNAGFASKDCCLHWTRARKHTHTHTRI